MRRKISLLTGTGMLLLVMLACSMPLGEAHQKTRAARTETAAATVSPTNTESPGATSTFAPTETFAPTTTATATKIPILCNRAKFIMDVNYEDGTTVKSGASFTKTWRLQNDGSCTWNPDYRLVFVSGESMSAPNAVQFSSSSVAPNGTVDVSVNLKAPVSAGTYRGYFKLRASDGSTFGIGDNADVSFWVEIVVENEESASSSSIPELTRTLKLTNPYIQGNDVKALQKRLLDLGYDVVGTADGIFGPKTDKGVREFQSDEGLTVDGIVGQKTWKALWE